VKRRWNVSLWAGFILVLAGLFSYLPIFIQFPITRDFPWVNLLILASGFVFLGRGLARAYKESHLYRGKIFGPLLTLLSLAGTGFFLYGLLYVVKQLPAATGAPRVGAQAPIFSLPDQNGKTVTLAGLLNPAASASKKANAVLLIFYRGHW
jgi:hypothetical protein